jgi:hypothetical protein
MFTTGWIKGTTRGMKQSRTTHLGGHITGLGQNNGKSPPINIYKH